MDAGICWEALGLPLRIDCVVAGKLEEGAKAEGDVILQDRQPEHSARAVEELLTYISHQLLSRKDPFYGCYYNCAATITSLFPPDQRAALLHLLSRVVRQHQRHLCKKRAKRADHKLVQESKVMPSWLKGELRRLKRIPK
jgi:hypothetical protein